MMIIIYQKIKQARFFSRRRRLLYELTNHFVSRIVPHYYHIKFCYHIISTSHNEPRSSMSFQLNEGRVEIDEKKKEEIILFGVGRK